MYQVWIIDDRGAYKYLSTTNGKYAAQVYEKMSRDKNRLVSISCDGKLIGI